MFGCRTAFGVGAGALVLCLASGCGGTTTHYMDGEENVSGTGQAGLGGTPSFGGSSAGRGGASSAGRPTGGASSMEPMPIEGGCPPEERPPPTLECDPFGVNTCEPGFGCYPFVEHPGGSGCDAQVYGTRCLVAGSGTQGQLCGAESGDWCAPGHVCVVGQRAGKRCAVLCRPGVAAQCTGGLVCGDLDVAGFGVCG